MLTALGEPGARPPTPLPAETRLVSTFPAARPGGLARPHSGSRGGRRDGRGPVSPDRAQRSAPPLPLLLSVPILLARATSLAPPPRGTRGTPVTSPPFSTRLRALSRKDAKVVTCLRGQCGCAEGLGTRTSCGAAWWKSSQTGRKWKDALENVISQRRGATAS